jgi:hypothetical protein
LTGASDCRVVNLAARCDVRGGVERRLGAATLQRLSEAGAVEMRGRSRARGEFGWLLTREDLEDRLSTDVAAAAAAIPPGVRVLTAHGTGAGGAGVVRVPAPAARQTAGKLPPKTPATQPNPERRPNRLT